MGKALTVQENHQPTSATRRTVVHGAVWAVPAVTIATAAPAYAASEPPDLSGSVPGPMVRNGAVVTLPEVTFVNSGGTAVTGVTFTFSTGANVINEIEIDGMSSADLAGVGISITGLGTTTVTLTTLSGMVPVPAGDSFLSDLPIDLTFADAGAAVSVQTHIIALEGGVPYISPTFTA